MHSSRRSRFQHLLNHIELLLLDDMAFDPRLHRSFESNASAPSLRSSEYDTPISFGTMAGSADQDSSTVKVVVRVRQFVKRGNTDHNAKILKVQMLMLRQNLIAMPTVLSKWTQRHSPQPSWLRPMPATTEVA